MFLLYISTLIAFVNSQCNYFQNEDWASGYAQPIGVCVTDAINSISRSYTCSDDGTMVTATTFFGDITCDENEASELISKTYTSSNASFECNDDSDCNLCVRTYGGNCDDVDSASNNNYYESCYIDGQCSQILSSAEPKFNTTPITLRSSRVECLSSTKFKITQWEDSDACSDSDATTVDSDTFEAGCSTRPVNGEVFYEILSIPCTSHGNLCFDINILSLVMSSFVVFLYL